MEEINGSEQSNEVICLMQSATLKIRGERGTGYLLYQDTIGTLCATDYKWVQQEQVEQGKLIVCVKR